MIEGGGAMRCGPLRDAMRPFLVCDGDCVCGKSEVSFFSFCADGRTERGDGSEPKKYGSGFTFILFSCRRFVYASP